MDAGGLARPDDLASMRDCQFLPAKAIARQIALRTEVISRTTSGFLSRLVQQEIVALRDMQQSREVRLRLILNHGSFVVLSNDGAIQTCYTDRTDTSRSSECAVDDLVEFARDVLRQFGKTEDPT